jgi:hypothetical protein
MAVIYSNGGDRWNILGFNFTKRDALSSVYKISMVWSKNSFQNVKPKMAKIDVLCLSIAFDCAVDTRVQGVCQNLILFTDNSISDIGSFRKK